jgi:hypothetical protein
LEKFIEAGHKLPSTLYLQLDNTGKYVLHHFSAVPRHAYFLKDTSQIGFTSPLSLLLFLEKIRTDTCLPTLKVSLIVGSSRKYF